jgi:hypothetical protein
MNRKNKIMVMICSCLLFVVSCGTKNDIARENVEQGEENSNGSSGASDVDDSGNSADSSVPGTPSFGADGLSSAEVHKVNQTLTPDTLVPKTAAEGFNIGDTITIGAESNHRFKNQRTISLIISRKDGVTKNTTICYGERVTFKVESSDGSMSNKLCLTYTGNKCVEAIFNDKLIKVVEYKECLNSGDKIEIKENDVSVEGSVAD